MKRIIKSKYFGKIKDIECKDYLTLIMNDWEVPNLKDYFRSYTPKEFKKEVNNINFDNPQKNPKSIKNLQKKEK